MSLQPLSPTPPAVTAAQPTQAPAIGWSRDEFDLLAVRAANEPERVQAATALYAAKLINFTMFKDMLDIRP